MQTSTVMVTLLPFTIPWYFDAASLEDVVLLGATIFFGIGGVINIRKYPGNIFATPYRPEEIFMTPLSRS